MHTNSLNFEQGDLVVADLLFSEQVGIKRRPALVISNSKYNQSSDDVVLLKITSQAKRTHFDVFLSNDDLLEGKLNASSMIMTDNLVTTYKKMVSSKIGKISGQKLKEVKQKLREIFEL